MNLNRIKQLKESSKREGNIIYWMSRDQRVYDNWALIFAINKSLQEKKKLAVVFTLYPAFLDATFRQYHFMIEGLKQVETDLHKLNIPFHLILMENENRLNDYLRKYNICDIISDFDPLKIKREWKNNLTKNNEINFFEVDTHNIIPVWITSQKQEYGAYTIRPKINRLIDEYLDEFPKIKKHPDNLRIEFSENYWEDIYKKLQIDFSIKEVPNILLGEKNALKVLEYFLENKVYHYDKFRNDPNYDYQSGLSPYLHFGKISAQRIAIQTKALGENSDSIKSFLEELIIRRELSDNYCYYNPNYDNINGFPEWAKLSLKGHLKDKREYIYNLNQFENAKTHDELWNAAQIEMVRTGKMHGYMRMYWAKKILEWTETPDEAQKIAIYLNDKYELDGRDPNGYTGIAWSIGGVHDRPWFEREVFGKIRYMNYNGCAKKFDVKKYISKFT